ncbi:sn-glycerol-3-phosphate ABC transporter ATP-binding protein UgpC [Leucobacter sp. CSA1]|uniref:Sn-glycerol-3-phosphate ABC transporter ATP-binding protein UgpC n=1 Tax=Leucobacter chromiisoli TaxID=2796471 RepID=A0A934Q6T6_9MICO|nr:sn-glycerol-3-phosphate ABC transporter ATP-binding protein UgpC [Leucobacter chromiisoli]MBK0418781.1 sn-glycerol-3-phosphate ABC transporter ATP-binding protein UgpC [Leucobacter chromiisoli]
MAEVIFENVRKVYGEHEIVSDLNLTLPDGSFTVLVGPSGCGKSTSLRMLAGLEPITSGRILVGGKDVTAKEPKERDISMVFQNYALYPHLTVRENIAFPLRANKTLGKQEISARVDEVAQTLGLASLADRRPKDLSGGQQQRVAIGRAIVRQPSAFLFDEPLSNLDAKLRVETRTELLQLQRRLGVTSLYVTHDQEEAMTLSDRMVVMRDGVIAQEGIPSEVYARPRSVFVATFVGSPKMNILRGRVAEGVFDEERGAVRLPVERAGEGEIVLGVRPDDLLVTPAAAPSGVRVELIELLGPRAIVTLDANGVQLRSVLEADALSGVGEGAEVELAIRPGSAHVFDPETEDRLEAGR